MFKLVHETQRVISEELDLFMEIFFVSISSARISTTFISETFPYFNQTLEQTWDIWRP